MLKESSCEVLTMLILHLLSSLINYCSDELICYAHGSELLSEGLILILSSAFPTTGGGFTFLKDY